MSVSSMSLSMTIDQEYYEQEIIHERSDETSSIPNNNHINNSRNAENYQQSLPVPCVSSTSDDTILRSKKDIENDLFQGIERLAREFVIRPNREFPYFRVMRWTTNGPPKIEEFITVVINQSPIQTFP